MATPTILIDVAGAEIPAAIDSGAMGGLLLPKRFESKLPLKTPPLPAGKLATLFREVELTKAQLNGTMRIGEIEFREPWLTFGELFDHANIGRDILYKLRVTFDQRYNRVRFDPAQTAAPAIR